jgi:membrane-bound serine protease (ClpP class)
MEFINTQFCQACKVFAFLFTYSGKKYQSQQQEKTMLRKLLPAFLSLTMFSMVHAQETNSQTVYIIPIKKMIEPALLYVVRRGVDEAVRTKAAAIILEMDTPGGAVNAAEGIITALTRTEIPTYTFVENDAYSAGAIIALATKHIYMAPGSVIGAATPMMMSPMGGVQDMPEDVKEKMTSAVAAMVRSAAEQGGHDKQLAEAMVRADMEYSVNGKVISEKGRLLTLTNEEAEQLVGEEQRPLLSEGTVLDIDELLETIGIGDAEQIILEVTAAERLARLIAGIAPILMMLGLGGLWLELKTPGFGFFGIAGILCLLLFFFGHHIAGLAGMEDLLLFIAGVALLAIEIFVTPGFGVMGISGLLLIFLSFINAMSENLPGQWRPVDFSPETLSMPFLKVMLSFTGALVLVAVAGRYLPKTRLFNNLTLDEVIAEPDEREDLLGLEGVAHSDLRPGGTAYFEGQKIDVVTHGDYIPRDTAVRIVEVHGNRIVVESSMMD